MATEYRSKYDFDFDGLEGPQKDFIHSFVKTCYRANGAEGGFEQFMEYEYSTKYGENGTCTTRVTHTTHKDLRSRLTIMSSTLRYLPEFVTQDVVILSVPFVLMYQVSRLDHICQEDLDRDAKRTRTSKTSRMLGIRNEPKERRLCQILLQKEWYDKWFSRFRFWKVANIERVWHDGKFITAIYVKVDQFGMREWNLTSIKTSWVKCIDEFAAAHIRKFGVE
jgi:hypothetical protein